MRRRFPARPWAAGLVLWLSAWPAFAQEGARYDGPAACATCATPGAGCAACKGGPCPPKWHYTYEGPPKIKWHKGCPRPVCDPCRLEHYGYYQTCWAPWPFAPDWSHCPCPPPGVALPPPPYPPYSPRVPRTPAGAPAARQPRGPELPGGEPGKAPGPAPVPELDPPRPLDPKSTVRLID
jgi:hypothetical protein